MYQKMLAAACIIAIAAPGTCFLPAAQPRMVKRAAAGAYMAVKSGKVAVYGAFDRTGCCVVKTMENGPFQAVIEVSPEYDNSRAKIKYPIDGQQTKGLPTSAQFTTTTPRVDAAVIASEKPVKGPEIAALVNDLQGLKKLVFLSKVGVDRRDEFMRKINPFLKLDEWYAAEEAAKSAAAANGLECTVLRAGDLIGGPFYDTTGDLQAALEGNLFDAEHKCMQVSLADTLDGKTSRDLAATALVQALQAEAPLLHVVSAKSGGAPCSVANHMSIKSGPRERRVYTPTPAEWAAALAQAQ